MDPRFEVEERQRKNKMKTILLKIITFYLDTVVNIDDSKVTSN